MKKSNDSFLQPIISVLGLATSLIVAILPLFSKEFLTTLFINKKLSQPVSFFAFVIGVAIIWQIIEFRSYIQIGIGKLKDRGQGYREYWRILKASHVIWLLIFSSIFFGLSFLYLTNFISNETIFFLGLIQALLYLLLFLCLISLFSLLFSLTRRRYIYEEERDNFPQIIFETLEKNRLVKPGIEIYEKETLTHSELKEMNIKVFGIAKRMKVKTVPQEEELIEFIVSSDGREIIKVLKKGK